MASFEGIHTLVDLCERSSVRYADRPLLGVKNGADWVYSTYAEVKAQVDALRAGLASLGVARGDRVGMIANNRPEWAVAAYATYGVGAAFVPMYEQQHERDWEFVIRDAGCKVLFVADRTVRERVAGFRSRAPTLTHVIDLSNELEGDSYGRLVSCGARASAPPCPVAPDEVAALLYTSGTTGNPKGVMLTHGNVISNIRAVQHVLPIDENDRSLAFLPWAHAFGHTAELHLIISIGASLAVCDGTDKILANLVEVRPSIIFAVPRVFNRLFASVEMQIASQPKLLRQLFRRGIALSSAERRGERLSFYEKSLLALCDRLIFSKVRARFGGRLRYAVSGAAALSREVAEFVDALRITVYEGYGLTETSPIVAVNVPGQRKMGSVGRPIDGVRVVIDPAVAGADGASGEIVVYGPNVMLGYYSHPEETAAVFTPDGGFRTGDMGYLDEDGYLHVTGRIKEQYKLENGKYVAPSPLEDALRLSPFIANVMVHGENRPFNVAVVVLNMEVVQRWAARAGIEANGSSLARHERVAEKIREELERCSRDFKSYERIKSFLVADEDFTLGNDLLTPSLKVKRRNVLRRWQDEIDRLYA